MKSNDCALQLEQSLCQVDFRLLDQHFCVDQHLQISSKTLIINSFFVIFASLSYKDIQKTRKKPSSTSILHAQHQNAGENIQLVLFDNEFLFSEQMDNSSCVHERLC